MEENKEERLKFPDYDPDVMETSDAKAIISHFEEIHPDLYAMFEKENMLMSYLYRHVDNYMEYIERFIKETFRLHAAREMSFRLVVDEIKTESIAIRKETQSHQDTLPSILFDLDINSQIDTDTL